MKLIDKLAWIEIRDRKILTARSKGKDKFYIPGGKRETGERDHDALIREIEEELSVTLKTDSLSYFGTFSTQAHGKATGTVVQMTCYTGSHDGELKEAAEIEEIAWLTFEERDKTSIVDNVIINHLRESGLM